MCRMRPPYRARHRFAALRARRRLMIRVNGLNSTMRRATPPMGLAPSVSPIGTEVVVGAVLLAAGGSAFAFGQRAAMAPRAMRVRAVRPAPARPKKGEEAGKEAGDQGGKGSGDKGSGDKGSGTNRK